MKSIFRPAVALMNRLSYAMKLSLATALFLIPLGILGYGLVAQLAERIDKTEHERVGLQRMADVYQALDQAYAVQDAHLLLGLKYDADHQRQAEMALAGMERALKRLEAPLACRKESRWAEAVANSRKVVDATTRKVSSTAGNLMDLLRELRPISASMERLLRVISDECDLLNDGTSATFYLGQIITEGVPEAMSTIASSKAVARYAVAQNPIASSTYDALASQVDSLIAYQKNAKQRLGYALSLDDGIRRSLEPRMQRALADLNPWIAFLNEQLIEAVQVNLSDAQVEAAAATPMKSWSGFAGAVTARLNEELSARSQRLHALMVLYMGTTGGALLVVLYLFMGMSISIRATIAAVSKAAAKMSRGDTTARVDIHTQDEMAELARAYNSMGERVHDLIQTVSVTATEVKRQAERMRDLAAEANTSVAEQREETEQITRTTSDLNASVETLTRNTEQVAKAAKAADRQAISGQDIVAEAGQSISALADEITASVAIINNLNDQSNNIAQVLEVIKSIAEQTNLLALNAAIEAARAGEQGRGFAVVADEVRALAQRTHESTQEIQNTIASLHEGVAQAVSAMEASHAKAEDTVQQAERIKLALSEIVHAVRDIVEQNSASEASAEEQRQLARQIDQLVVRINEHMDRAANSSDDTLSASEEVASLATELGRLVEQFKI
jgi:methyl-accepting chemotaxis protein